MELSHFVWNEEKNRQLIDQRGLSFENVATSVEDGKVLYDGPHPDKARFPNQYMLVVEINGYACMVPYVIDGDSVFLKTIFPSRKANRLYSKVDDEPRT